MKIVVATKERLYSFFSAYAPQIGCSDQAKDEFWSLLDEKTAEVPSKDVIMVAGDPNGHVGATKEGYSCHGGFGYGSRNADDRVSNDGRGGVSSMKANGIELPRTSVFKYLGSAVASDGNLRTEVNSRVSAVWSKWRSLTGVLCDRKIPEHLKSKIYRAVVRPVAMYGTECWPATKKLKRASASWRRRCCAGRLESRACTRNNAIRQKFDVAPIADKTREARLRWYGHVLRGKEDSVRKIGLELEMSGKRPRGRPKQRWSNVT
ncbi:unnamed protein product [Heligmosomoides polygyrus]|uniref:Craniofacial development protein 2-like n=1 Tax=Heligmosomoides polygyrus TaxID=6339 RepID=A0A183GCK6_HELPZ|nr:unnamed protein product [Heligmosomoides polygyrus]